MDPSAASFDPRYPQLPPQSVPVATPISPVAAPIPAAADPRQYPQYQPQPPYEQYQPFQPQNYEQLPRMAIPLPSAAQGMQGNVPYGIPVSPAEDMDHEDDVRPRADFSTCRYLDLGVRTYRNNACTLLGVILVYGLLGFALNVGSDVATRAIVGRTMLDPPHHHNHTDSDPGGPGHLLSLSPVPDVLNVWDVPHAWAALATVDQDPHSQEYLGQAMPDPSRHLEVPDRPPVTKRDAKAMLCYLAVKAAFAALFSLLVYRHAASSCFTAIFNGLRRPGQRVHFADFFSSFKCDYYCSQLRLNALMLLADVGLFLLLIIPGLWWSLVSVFAIPAHSDQRPIGARTAIKRSIRAVHTHFCSMLGFFLVLGLLNLLGALCFGVGLLLTLPITLLALCHCYHDIIGVRGLASTRSSSEVYPIQQGPALHVHYPQPPPAAQAYVPPSL